MKICKNCDIEFVDDFKFCPMCGAELEFTLSAPKNPVETGEEKRSSVWPKICVAAGVLVFLIVWAYAANPNKDSIGVTNVKPDISVSPSPTISPELLEASKSAFEYAEKLMEEKNYA
jgi:uncharacterized membrane protein YvbJ